MHRTFLKMSLMLIASAIMTACTEEVGDTQDSEAIGAMAEVTIAEADTTSAPETEPPTEPLEAPSGYTSARSRRLNVEAVMQKPELPTGCEVTALTSLLNYCGFDIDKVELCDEFMPIVSDASATFDEAYIGDPRAENGFGCNAPVIVKTAESYLESVDADWGVLDLTGTDFQELFYQIDKGRPVVVWASMGLRDVKMRLRWVTEDGDEAWFAELEHCMVLTGYDKGEGIVYAADPLKGNVEYSLERFESVYEQLGKQAVIIYEEEQPE